jgi:hypothetical protein
MSKWFRLLSQIILIIIGIGLPLTLSAQILGMPPSPSNFGYVVLSNGDTLQGLIKWRLKYVENNLAEISFTAKNGNSKIFSAGEISGFGYYPEVGVKDFSTQEGEYYESVPSLKNGIPVFVFRFLDGRIKIFLNRSAIVVSSGKVEETANMEGISFTFKKEAGLFIGADYKISYRINEITSPYSNFFISKDKGPLLKVDKNNYESVFQILFGDCPDIGKELDNNPELTRFKHFILLSEVYNQICK